MSALLRAVNRPVLAIVAVAMVAGGLRFYNLDFPPGRVFDEVYYSKDACNYLQYSVQTCDIRSESERDWRETRGEVSWVHPPLGKWAIASGEAAFGIDPLGWRFSAALFGTLSVVALALIAQVLFGSPLWTFVSGLLLATEGLHFVQSRTAMLDIFLAFWVVLGFLFLALDRRWIDRRTSPSPQEPEPHEEPDRPLPPVPERPPAPLWRPWRYAAGVAFGAGFATKWSGATAIFAALVLSLLWERTRRKNRARHPIARTLLDESFGIAVAFLLIPIVVYIGSYTPWFVDRGVHLAHCWPFGAENRGESFDDWCDLQNSMREYHANLETTESDPKTRELTPIHPYLSEPEQWLVLARPILYFAEYPSDEARRVIYANGNPAIFWGSLLAMPYLAVVWVRRRDWRAGFVLLAVLGQYLPWFAATRPLFFFYMTPIAPFLVLADVFVAKELSEMRVAGSRSRPYLPIAVGFVAASVALFAFFYPVLTGSVISTTWWERHVWMPGWV